VAFLSGKNGLVVGIANKRSLAWAIAKAADAAGAHLSLSYATERFESNARKLAETLENQPQLIACDVTDDSAIANLSQQVDSEYGGLDFLVHAPAFASRESLANPFVQTSRGDFAQSLDISAYSLSALTCGVAPLMERRGGGSILTLTYLGSERVVPHYNVMGVSKAALEASVRYLASDLGPQNIRVNAVSAGPIKTLASSGISGFTTMLQHVREKAPLRRTVDASEIADAALFFLSPLSRGITGEILHVDGGYNIVGM
tara:strand:+ start:61 stop:837 length:777 start_codon:yes stop_codon:yes gene_type:complete